MDCSPPGSPVPGILQARTLEWVAISFSNAWKWKVKVESLSHVWLLATPWTAAYQAPPSMGFSGQQYWSGVPLPSPCFRLDLSKLTLTCLPAISGYWSGSLCLLLYIVSPCRQRLTRNPQVPSVRVGGWGSVPGKSRWGGFPCWDPRLWRSDSLWSWYTSHCGWTSHPKLKR